MKISNSQLSKLSIAHTRLVNQGITTQPFDSAVKAVKHLGTVQAQDYYGGLWSIGLRIPNSTEPEIEQSLLSGQLVRTWPMRGTIHIVAAEDTKWMLDLLAARVNKRMASYFRKAELTDAIFGKCADALVNQLQGGKILTRNQIYTLWEEMGVSTKNTRGLFIIDYLAQTGLICFGPRQGKQPTFVLLDEWVSHHRKLSGAAAIAELAVRYFSSHGPAQLKDFGWWSGLTLGEINTGLEALGGKLVSQRIGDKVYWMADTVTSIELSNDQKPKAYLLQAYDEYTVAYTDRSDIFNNENVHKVKNGKGFTSVFILNGEVMGFWKRTLKKDRVEIELDTFRQLDANENILLESAAADYAKFIGLEPVIV